MLIAVFDAGALSHPAGGSVSAAPLAPSHLLVNGVGGVLALSIAAFLGYESGTAYTEEARTDHTVRRATVAALGFLDPFHALSSWALAVAAGSGQVVQAA